MDPKHLVLGTALGVSLYLSYLASQRTGFVSGLIVFTTIMLLFATFRQGLGMGIWKGLSNLTSPFITAFMGFFLGFSYAVFEMPSANPWMIGIASLFIGGLIGIMTFNYWNIGG